jgi:hypothetical protein
LRIGRSGAVLFLGLLLLGGAPLVQSVGGQVERGATTIAATPHVEPLATSTVTTVSSITSTQPLPFAINGTIWQDESGDTCADCTYSVHFESSGSNVFFLAMFYLTDPSCPSAVGTEFVNVDVGSDGSMLNDAPGHTTMQLCTRASNPVVADCGQDALWSTTYSLTVTQNSISGVYQGQYWTWDTAADGSISNCKIDHNYSQPFTLTPVFSTASQSSSATSTAATSQQNTGPTNSPPSQTSSRSSTNSSSTSTSTHTSASGSPGLEIVIVVAVVLVLVAGVSWVFLRTKR